MRNTARMSAQTAEEMRANDMARIQNDLEDLYAHIGSTVSNMADDTKRKWEETRAELENKRSDLKEQYRQLSEASSAASADLKAGFDSAMGDFKESVANAHRRFEGKE